MHAFYLVPNTLFIPHQSAVDLPFGLGGLEFLVTANCITIGIRQSFNLPRPPGAYVLDCFCTKRSEGSPLIPVRITGILPGLVSPFVTVVNQSATKRVGGRLSFCNWLYRQTSGGR